MLPDISSWRVAQLPRWRKSWMTAFEGTKRVRQIAPFIPQLNQKIHTLLLGQQAVPSCRGSLCAGSSFDRKFYQEMPRGCKVLMAGQACFVLPPAHDNIVVLNVYDFRVADHHGGPR